jgi:hypothetical protein
MAAWASDRPRAAKFAIAHEDFGNSDTAKLIDL